MGATALIKQGFVFLGLPLFLFVSLSWGALFDTYRLAEGEFDEIVELSQAIRNRFPSDQYFIIFVGRSPTPIQTYLELNQPQAIGQIPFSRTRRLAYPVPTGLFAINKYALSEYGPLTRQEEKSLFTHFDRFVPTREAIGNRRILMVDYSQQGLSLFSAGSYLKKYFNEKGIAPPIDYLAITSAHWREKFLTMARAIKEEVSTPIYHITMKSGSVLADKMGGTSFDPFAKYGEFVPGWEPARIQLNYHSLRETFSTATPSRVPSGATHAITEIALPAPALVENRRCIGTRFSQFFDLFAKPTKK